MTENSKPPPRLCRRRGRGVVTTGYWLHCKSCETAREIEETGPGRLTTAWHHRAKLITLYRTIHDDLRRGWSDVIVAAGANDAVQFAMLRKYMGG